ncbi:MAG: hypothetical protein IJ012_04600 [Clostridia bacterium]|nr:hypothetical protein [Clostridia bacterium]
MKKICFLTALCLLLASVACLFTACGDGEFDYRTADMSEYVSFDGVDYRDVKLTIKETITDADVKADFNSFFTSSSTKYYRPIEDKTRPIEDDDYVYMLYSGVTVAALEAAVKEGKISDVDCTGLSYTEIVDLGLGFEGGTSPSLACLRIGSNTFIPGFESGLIGYVPAAKGEEDPVRLHLTFPTNYGNDLAGKDVVFFCKLFYIGYPGGGVYTADTMKDAELLNLILGLTGEDAYTSMEDCFAKIRTYLEENLEANYQEQVTYDLFAALAKMATFRNVPASLVTQYIDDWFTSRFEYLQQANPELYAYYFDPDNPSRDTLANLYGYGEDYMDVLTEEANNAVRQEMVFRYVVQLEGCEITDADYKEWDAKYKETYGENYANGVDKDDIYDRMLRDKLTTALVAIAEERGNITRT